MQLTLFSDYSLRVLLYLAAHRGRRVTLQEIGEAYGISQNHLVKVVQRLVELELVLGHRGRGGGLELSCEPITVNIGAVLRRTESQQSLIECFDAKTNTCPIAPKCGLKGMLWEAQSAFFETLERYTLADLIPRGPALIQIWNKRLQERVNP